MSNNDIVKKNETTSLSDKKSHSDIKNKILLISIVVFIFIFSVGIVAWVVIKENYYREDDVQVLRYPKENSSVFIAQNETQEELLEIKETFEDIDSDVRAFNEILEKSESDSYGKLLID